MVAGGAEKTPNTTEGPWAESRGPSNPHSAGDPRPQPGVCLTPGCSTGMRSWVGSPVARRGLRSRGRQRASWLLRRRAAGRNREQ